MIWGEGEGNGMVSSGGMGDEMVRVAGEGREMLSGREGGCQMKSGGESGGMVALLLSLLEGSEVSFGPSGRLRHGGHHPAATLRSLLLSSPHQRFGAFVSSLLTELRTCPPPAREASLLITLTIACSASSPPHVEQLTLLRRPLLAVLALSTPPQTSGGRGRGEGERLRLQALTTLVTNERLRFERGDGTLVLHAAASSMAGLSPSSPSPILPSPALFNCTYFLLLAMLRQRPKATHAALHLLLAAVRGMLCALGHASPGGVKSPPSPLPSRPPYATLSRAPSLHQRAYPPASNTPHPRTSHLPPQMAW